MVNSRKGAKGYFLPVYLFWAVITPTIMILLNAWLFKDPDQSLIDGIVWRRVPSLYALFGLVWPLTIVISPAFYQAFTEETGYTFFASLSNLGDPNAEMMAIAGILFYFAWLGPLISLITAIIYHKRHVNQSVEKEIDWYDYIAGFI